MIRCRQQFNIKCLKCDKMEYEMVRIGVIYTCMDCYLIEFGNVLSIDPKSKLGKKYYRWLDIYSKQTT